MNTEKIKQDLNRRFSALLPEFYKRRIIFWYDEDREFEDKLDNITVGGVKIIALTGNNNYYVKKLLNVDDTASNYLIYSPLSYEDLEENWLLDMQLYSEEFRADLISMWMDEMGIPQTPALRKGFREYRKFFNAQARRNKVKSLPTIPNSLAGLQLAIMAVLAGLKEAKPNRIIKAVLEAGLDIENNEVYQSFVSYDIHEAFWRMAGQGTGYEDEEKNLLRFSSHILITALTRTMRQEFLSGLGSFISSAHQAYCYDLVSEWMHSEDVGTFREVAETVETECKLPQRFMKLEVEDLVGTEIFPCLHEVILIKLMTEIKDNIIDINTIRETVEKRRICIWYENYKYFYEGLLEVAKMQSFFKDHADGFHIMEPDKVWREYTTEYCQMDTFYRRFHVCYSDSLKNYHPDLTDLFTQVMEKVETLYSNWFLDQLGSNWTTACQDSMAEYGRIISIPQQTDFYNRYVASSDSRVYVIISDAMRYEVAAELAEQLEKETQAKVKMSSVQGIFPTTTKFGMAALLPHKTLTEELKAGQTDRLAVLADGQSTESNNRQNVLQSKDKDSIAVQYKNIIGMKRADRKAMVKGMNVIYIYHDTIDEAGHLEKSIFGACQEAIDELKNLVRIITNELSGTNIVITSDHGFLYTHSPLKEDAKVGKTTKADDDIEIGRRYAIMKKDADPEFLIPVKFLKGKTDYAAFAPRDNIRIKKAGGGSLNFVHGGLSLQEMVVPVIQYHFLRNDSKEYKKNKSKYDTMPVEISLLSANRKISNMIFSLNFYQKEPVSANREKATYMVYFTDSSGQTISDMVTIIADKISKNSQERTFRCSFNLKSMNYDSKEIYYLVIADADGLVVSREEFRIDIAFAVDDFDFFS